MDNQAKLSRTMNVLEEYENRFLEARLARPPYAPLDAAAREEVISRVKAMLGFRDEWVPTVHHVEVVLRTPAENYDVLQLRYETWDNFYGAATYYQPHGAGKHPIAFGLCGHSKEGRRCNAYATMARRLADLGFATIVLDNIGQGDRAVQEHWRALAPFGCGLTLQGMIVMETIGVIRYMLTRPEIDATRAVACGNSGGGTLTTLLAALAPELSAIATTGYPSEFHYIFCKERNHCACNILPTALRGPDMWQILSAFAPKPLLMEQGVHDEYIPVDYFHRCARRVAHTYETLGARANFYAKTVDAKHPWAEPDIRVITEFLANAAGLPFVPSDVTVAYADHPDWEVPMPEGSLTTAELARRLSGKDAPDTVKLSDVFPPQFGGKLLSRDDIVSDFGRGDLYETLAQMESALWENPEWGV